MCKGSRQNFPEPGLHAFTAFYDVVVVCCVPMPLFNWKLFVLSFGHTVNGKDSLVSEFGIAQ